MNTAFSIVIPTYNRAAQLKRALDSVVGQAFSDWECIVVDDGGTDHSKAVVSAFNDERLSYHYKENEERNLARNYGASLARGEYLIFLDSDDEFLSDHLQNLSEQIRSEPSASFIFCPYRKVNADQEILSEHFLKNKQGLVKRLCYQNFIPPSAACVMRSLFSEVQFPISSTLLIGEDLCLWLRLLSRVEMTSMKKLSVQMNMHEGQSMATPPVGRVLESMNELLHTLKQDEHFSHAYLGHLELIEASFYSLAALSAVLKKDKKRAMGLLKEAFKKNGLAELFRKRNQAVLKHLLFS